jgi:hypothetical protein
MPGALEQRSRPTWRVVTASKIALGAKMDAVWNKAAISLAITPQNDTAL